jgi:hypothetical protein
MISDRDAIAQAQALYREACKRLRKLPRETVGEIAFAEGLKVVVLFDSNAKLAGAYRVSDDAVSDLNGAELVKLRTKLTNRKVR